MSTMIKAEAHEKQRLAALHRYDILDSETEQDFDDIVQLASNICETPISLISLVDENRQWFKSRLGLEAHETHRNMAFCAHAINENEVMMIEDATKDDRFAGNPLVTGHPNIRFYAGMPLKTPDGFNLGTLCVIDRKPRELSEQQIFGLKTLAKQVVKQMELRIKIKELETQKTSLQKLNTANSRLLSIIGHDLRSPLSMLTGLVHMSSEKKLTQEKFQDVVKQLEANLSSANELLGSLFEWAVNQFEGRSIRSEEILLDVLVTTETQKNLTQLKQKNNTIINEVEKDLLLFADDHALSFIIRNLILNANKFTENGTIRISSKRIENDYQICISDTGVGMEPDFIEKLFDGSFRNSSRGTQGEKGSGLGLQVCKELIEKQGGKIWVKSFPGKGSSFYFSIPSYQKN